MMAAMTIFSAIGAHRDDDRHNKGDYHRHDEGDLVLIHGLLLQVARGVDPRGGRYLDR